MARLNIPSIGDTLVLSKDWPILAFDEYRNMSLIKMFYESAPPGRFKDLRPYPVTIPAGTSLKVSRIYIRSGSKAYDSVTFSMKKQKVGSFVVTKAVRFWVKLEDVNQLEYESSESPW